jgi:hypothetical protein
VEVWSAANGDAHCGADYFSLLAVSWISCSGFGCSTSGQRWALLQGGVFDYSRYHKVREEHGWAAWPVYLMWVAWTCGIALLIAGPFLYFGKSPTHTK